METEFNLFPPIKSGYFIPFISKCYRGIYYIYYYNPKTEKRTKKSTRTRNQNEACKIFDNFKKSYLNNRPQINIKFLSELAELIKNVNKNMSPRTIVIYQYAISKLISLIGNRVIRLINYVELDNFKNTLCEKLKPNSVNIYLRTLKAALNYAKKIGVIDENPMNGVKFLKIPEAQKLCFEDEEIELLMSEMNNVPHIKQIVKFALLSGCRISEILNLEWDDVDFNKTKIMIVNKPDFHTKTLKIREIPMSDLLYNLLLDLRYKRQEQISLFESNIYELKTTKKLCLL